MINWKQKLTSRKFWAAVVSFVALLVVSLGGTEAQATQITALIMAGATVIAYIVGEGLVDAASAGATVNNYDAPSTPAVDTVDTPAADGTPTGAAQAAETKTDTVLPSTPAEPQDGADGKTDTPAAVTPQTGAEDKSGADA